MDDSGFTLPPKLYDFLKYVALVILPAAAALVLGLGLTLNWSPATAVAGAITLIDTFLGAILGKSSSNYFKQEMPVVFGDLVIKQDAQGIPIGMKFVGHHENFVFEEGMPVLLKVKREQDIGFE